MSECEYQALSQYDNGRQTNSCNRAGNKDICISFCCYLLQALDSSEQHLHNAFEHDGFQGFQESRIHSDTLHANNGTSPHSSSLLDDEMQRVFQVQSCGEMCSHTSCKHEDSSCMLLLQVIMESWSIFGCILTKMTKVLAIRITLIADLFLLLRRGWNVVHGVCLHRQGRGVQFLRRCIWNSE